MGKINAITTKAVPELTDRALGSEGSSVGSGTSKNYVLSALKALFQKNVVLDTSALPSYLAAQLSYDPDSLTIVADTGVTGVRVQIGQEMQYLVVNRSGSIIANGAAVYASGADASTELLTIELADASDPTTSISFIGIVTAEIPIDGIGLVTDFGVVRDFDTDHLTAGRLSYLGTTPGMITSTAPAYPSARIGIGSVTKKDATTGKIQVSINRLNRPAAFRDYGFTSNGIGAGTYFRGGFYDFATADLNLDEGSPTGNYGSANVAKAAHASAIFGGAGTVVGGVVGLRVNGDSITDDGVTTVGDSEVISADITALSLNQYLETPKKWNGTIEFELFVVSGTPTAYSLDFNYGFAKYEDFGNIDFTINGVEVVGLAGANDTSFDIELLKHSDSGWTYAATGFVPGDGAIATWSTDMAPYDNLANGQDFAWKRANLAEFIDGSASEGSLFRITCGANNSVQSMDLHINGVIETLS